MSSATVIGPTPPGTGVIAPGYFADAFKIDIAAELAVFVPVHADVYDRRAGLYHIRGYHFRPADRRDEYIGRSR